MSRICGKLFSVQCPPTGGQGGVHRDPNTIGVQCPVQLFSNTCQKMRGSKHVKVKKQQCQDILQFHTDMQKMILGSI